VTTDRRPIRATLAVTIVLGLVYLVAVPLVRPDQVAVATDVYYHAGQAVLSGGDPYAVTPPGRPDFFFIYPPLVLLAFVPHVLTGSPLGAYLLQTLLNVATAGALAVLLCRGVADAGVELARCDRLLVGGVALGSVHSIPVLVMGQVNIQLALAIAVGARLVTRDRGGSARGRERLAGVAFALAAAVKLFPAVAGAWLLRLRAWRAAGAAVVTGLGTIAAGALAFGLGPTRAFFTEVLPAERQSAAFAGGLDPSVMFVSVRRPLGTLLPDLGSGALAALALALLVPAVLASVRDVSSETGRLVALLATLLATLSYLPLEPFYYALLYYPVVVLLYRLEPGRVRRLFLAGTTSLSLIVSYPSIEQLLLIAPLPTGIASTLDAAARTVFSVAQPPLAGVVLLLAGCVLWQHERAAESDGATDVRGDRAAN
jgi:hypothetical protein